MFLCSFFFLPLSHKFLFPVVGPTLRSWKPLVVKMVRCHVESVMIPLCCEDIQSPLNAPHCLSSKSQSLPQNLDRSLTTMIVEKCALPPHPSPSEKAEQIFTPVVEPLCGLWQKAAWIKLHIFFSLKIQQHNVKMGISTF